MTATITEPTVAQKRGHLRANHPGLAGKRGRLSAEALAQFDADVAAGRFTA